MFSQCCGADMIEGTESDSGCDPYKTFGICGRCREWATFVDEELAELIEEGERLRVLIEYGLSWKAAQELAE